MPPFDTTPKEPHKSGLKPIVGQKSMFEGKVKPPTQQEHQQNVEKSQQTQSANKQRAAKLFIQFNNAIMDKTLPQNRNIFNIETEKEMLQNMIQLGMDLDADPDEQEGIGALSLIVVLLKTCMAQRDRINEIEYSLYQFQQKINPEIIADLIKREFTKTIDKK